MNCNNETTSKDSTLSQTCNRVEIPQTSKVGDAQTSNEVKDDITNESVFLWDGPSTCRDVHFLNVSRIEPSAYTCAVDVTLLLVQQSKKE